MILVKDEESQPYRDAGLWGDDPQTHSLDGLLRANAKTHGEAIALSDAPDRNVWTSGDARSLTWSELNQHVDVFATFLKGLSLSKDAVVALYGPNTVDMAAASLAINRAGLIAAPMPLFWREVDMRDYLSEVQARAIITVDRVEDDSPALRCRDLAQSLFSMKFVAGFGDKLPDGVVTLDKILPAVSDMMESEPTFEPIHPDKVITLHATNLQSKETEVALPRSSNQWLSSDRALFGEIEETKQCLSPFALSGLVGFCSSIVHTLKHAGSASFHHYKSENTLAGHIDLIKPDLVLLPQGLVAAQAKRLSISHVITIGCVWKNNHLGEKPIAQIKGNCRLLDISVLNEVAALGQSRQIGADTPQPLPMSDDIRDLSLQLLQPKSTTLKVPGKLAGGELIATGASAPEALFPTNSEQRALARLRNKTSQKGAYTHVACRLNEDDEKQCEPIGFLIDTIQRFNQVTVAAELDDLYKSMPNIIDAAHFIDPTTNELNLAVVTSGATPTREEFAEALKAMGVSPLKAPQEIFAAPEIKRGVGGVVIRHELLALLEQNKARKLMEARQQAAI